MRKHNLLGGGNWR